MKRESLSTFSNLIVLLDVFLPACVLNIPSYTLGDVGTKPFVLDSNTGCQFVYKYLLTEKLAYLRLLFTFGRKGDFRSCGLELRHG